MSVARVTMSDHPFEEDLKTPFYQHGIAVNNSFLSNADLSVEMQTENKSAATVTAYVLQAIILRISRTTEVVGSVMQLLTLNLSSLQIMYYFSIEFLELAISISGHGEGGCDCTALAIH